MLITPQSANQLCNTVIQSFLNWRALKAALQSGALESKPRGRFAAALETWLADYERSELIVLPEYLNNGTMDFTFVDPVTVTSAQLSVDTVVEVKFNYACQANEAGGEIYRRTEDAIEQASAYSSSARRPVGTVENADSYVLYLIAAPTAIIIPEPPRDTGWKYFNARNVVYSHDAIHRAAAAKGWHVISDAASAAIGSRTPLLRCYFLGSAQPA